MTLEYEGPDGAHRTQPALHELEQAVRERGPEYWHAGNGDACLRYSELDWDNLLFLLFNEERGFVVRFEEGRRPGDDGVPVGRDWVLTSTTTPGAAGEDDAWFETRLGAAPARWRARSFASPSVAWPVVAAFCRDGRRPPPPAGYAWVDSEEVDVQLW